MRSEKGFANILVVVAILVGMTVLGFGFWTNYKNGHLSFKSKQLEDKQGDLEQSQTPQPQNQNAQAPEIGITNESNKPTNKQVLKQNKNQQDTNSQAQDIPSCPKNISGIFTYPIVDNDAIDHIPPMGHINAKNKHVLPIPHTYIIFKKDGDVTRKTQIFSPADLLVQDISKVDVFDKSGKLVLSDFSIYFSPCKEIRVSFIHVSELSDLMAQMYNAVEAYCYRAGANINICKADINKKITAGDPIGWGGYSLPGLDVPIDDTRVSHPFISKERYNTHSLQGICPLDLYAGDLKISLYDKLTDPDGNKRITEPRCGSVAQDIAGTAQGEWFAPGTHELSADAESNGKVLSIVHYNLEPSPGLAGVIAASGTIVPYSGMIAFVPRHDGFINREPSEIKDQNIFCFQNEQGSFTKYVVGDGRIFTGRILTQLVDASRLKAEYQEKNCDEAFNFVSPTIYER